MKFLGEVEEGMKGRRKGLDTSMERLSRFVNGVQKRSYTAVGAQSKSGKTAFVDEFFVLGPYLNNPAANVKWLYFSAIGKIYTFIKSVWFDNLNIYDRVANKIIFNYSTSAYPMIQSVHYIMSQ